MNILNNVLAAASLTVLSIASANAYNAKAYGSEGQDYALITVYEDSHGSLAGYGRSTVWEAGLNEVISYNKRTKRPEVVDIVVQTHGYDARWMYYARISCNNPIKSYIYEPSKYRAKISFKQAMALDYGNPLYIERKAVEGIFSTYC